MRILFLLIISCFIGRIQAQQEPQLTMYWNNHSLYNPAVSGLFNKHLGVICGRNQWVEFPGNPKTATALYDLKLNPIHGGLGINYIYDQFGFVKNNRINLNYAFHLGFNEGRVLSFGISGGIHSMTIDGSHFIAIDDPANDPAIPKGEVTETKFNSNFRLFYKTGHWKIGLSTTQINKPVFKELNINKARHYWLSCTYKYDIGKAFDIQPGVLVKADLISTQVDFNTLLTYKKWYWAGITYRTGDALAFMGGVDIKGKYRVGYSYDYTLSSLANHSKGSHEIILAVMLDK